MRRAGVPAALLGVAIGCALAAARLARADVTLPALLSDGAVLQRDVPVPIWGKAVAGEKVAVTLGAQTAQTITGADGRWQVALSPVAAGGPYEIDVQGANRLTRKDILFGDVYLCSGQSNMELSLGRASNGPAAIAGSADPELRFFRIARAQPATPADDVRAVWRPAGPESSGGFSAVGYFFGRALRRAEHVPIGLIGSYVGGTPGQAWTREEILAGNPDLKRRYIDTFAAGQATHDRQMAAYVAALASAKALGKREPQRPYNYQRYSTLYNGMIAPLTPAPLRGVLWYQAESNAADPVGYGELLPAMITDWRSQWRAPAMPFLLVQLPAFGTTVGNGTGWAELREAQARTARTLASVGMVVTIDVGTQHNIHPTDKEPVGERLALLARKMIYGESALVAGGPTLRNATFTGDKATIQFDNAGDGLEARAGTVSGVPVTADALTGFTLAGADGKFVPAVAKITGRDTVEVSATGVAAPKSVRFGFVNFPVLNLWNKNGLPAAPFRTDAPAAESRP
jgi:sialate O-acetylesterase